MKNELIELLNNDDFDVLQKSLLKYSKELCLEGSENSLLKADKLAFLAHRLSSEENISKIDDYLKLSCEEKNKIHSLENEVSILLEKIEELFVSSKNIIMWVKDNYIYTSSIYNFKPRRFSDDDFERSIEIWKTFESIENGDCKDINLEQFLQKLIRALKSCSKLGFEPETKNAFPKWSIKRGLYLEFVSRMIDSNELIKKLEESLEYLPKIQEIECEINTLKSSLFFSRKFELKESALEFINKVFQ